MYIAVPCVLEFLGSSSIFLLKSHFPGGRTCVRLCMAQDLAYGAVSINTVIMKNGGIPDRLEFTSSVTWGISLY